LVPALGRSRWACLLVLPLLSWIKVRMVMASAYDIVKHLTIAIWLNLGA
jgi:hypothetical protein